MEVSFDVKTIKNKIITSPIMNLRSMLIILFGETLSSNPGKSTVLAHCSVSSSLTSDEMKFLKKKR